MHRAALYGDAASASKLVTIGFNSKAPDRRGSTPKDLADRIFDPKQRAEVLAALQSVPPSESKRLK